MIDVVSIYKDCQYSVNKTEGGYLSIDDFNGLSKRAELRLMDYLTGDINNQVLPIPYESQKNSDWLSPFITPYKKNIVNGVIGLPIDYYGFEELFVLGGFTIDNCEDGDGEKKRVLNTPIEVLSSSKFTNRTKTFVKGLKPRYSKPIATIEKNTIRFEPTDLGSVQLSYIRYPIFAELGSTIDDETTDEIPTAIQNYEYGEWARELLIYFITDFFSNHIREQALKQFNQLTNKLVRV